MNKKFKTFVHFRIIWCFFWLSYISAKNSEFEASIEQINGLLWNVSQRSPNMTSIPLLNLNLAAYNNKSIDTAVINVTSNDFQSLNSLIENRHIWRALRGSEQIQMASNILQLITDLGTWLNDHLDLSQIDQQMLNINFSSILIQSKLFKIDKNTQNMEFNLDHNRLELPFDAFENSSMLHSQMTTLSATSIMIKNLTNRLSTTNIRLNSHLISVIVNDNFQNNLHSKQFHFWHRHRLEFFDHPQCAFWNFSLKAWSTDGCTYRTDGSTRYLSFCECSVHLENDPTVFGLLVDVSHQEGIILAKSILTYIFSSFTCLFLGLAVYILVVYQEVCRRKFESQKVILKKETNKISLAINISIYLLLSHVFLMFGFKLRNQMLCNLSAIFQLFSLLATLSFMMLLSFHYFLVQFQFLDRFLHFKYFNWIGHAIPTIIIIGSFFYISLIEETEILESLSGDYFCWLSSQRYPNNIWIFIYPASGLLFGTILSCALILFRCCLPLGKTNVKFDLMLFNVLLLVLNFGIPWIAYTLYINEYFGHFAYFFIFFNAIQGLFFFTFQYGFYRINSGKEDSSKRRKWLCLFFN